MKIILTESQFKNLLNERKGESTTRISIVWLINIRKKLEKIYGKNRGIVSDKIGNYIDIIEKHNLKDAQWLFNNFVDKFQNRFINRPDDWFEKQQRDFEQHYNKQKKQSNKLDTPFELTEHKIVQNINYLIENFFN